MKSLNRRRFLGRSAAAGLAALPVTRTAVKELSDEVAAYASVSPSGSPKCSAASNPIVSPTYRSRSAIIPTV